MDQHRCKLCSRRFSNGRALGGHMRSHFTILPIPDKAQPSQLSETSSSSSDSKQLEKTTTSLIQLEGSVVLDGESETESRSFVNSPGESEKFKKQCRNEFRKLGMKKSKMSSTESGTELKLVSSVASETTSEEDLAMCLMLLSRDKWVRTDQNFQEKKRGSASRDNFQLGHEKIHQCQVCYKVFKSGQALGGHKRSHPSSSTAAASAAISSASANASLIDLNMPAPLEDVKAVSHSQIQVFC